MWGLLSLSRLQKTQLKASLSEKHVFRLKKKKKKEGMAGASFFSTSERSKGQSIQSHKRLFEKIKCVTHRSPQYLSRSQKREEIISHPENAIPVEMLLVCTERGREETKMKESWTTFKTLPARSRSIGALHSKLYSLNEKGKVTQRVEPWTRRTEPRIIEEALNPSWSLPSWISKLLGTSNFFPFLSFWTEISLTVILRLCLFRAENFFI